MDTIVADALSRMFEGESSDNPEMMCATMLGSLPLTYSPLQEHQSNDAFCNDLSGKVESKEASGKNSCMHNGAVLFPQGEEAPVGCAAIFEGHVFAVLSRRYFCRASGSA